MRAAIYCRISGPGEAAIARQLADCQELIAERDWSVVEVLVDEGRSAYSGARRPDYERLLRSITDGTVDVVVAWHLDRLHRRPDELERFLARLADAEVDVATVVSGEIAGGTAEGQFKARLAVAVARHEMELTAERKRRAHRHRAELGLAPHRRAYGYRRLEDGSMEVVPTEAAVVRDMVARLRAGESVSSLVRSLNRRGIPASSGGRWWVSGIRPLLTSPRMAGWTVFDGRRIRGACWEAILSEADLTAMQDLFATKTTVRVPTECLLGAAVLRCGLCGAGLGRGRNRGHPRYACPTPSRGGCGGVSMRARLLDGQVTESLLDRLDDPEAPWLTEAEDTDPRIALDQARTREEETRQLRRDLLITPFEYRVALRITAEREARCRRRLEDRPEAPAGGAMRASWARWPLEHRRAVAARLIRQVLLHPVDAERRLTIAWHR